MSPEVPLVDPQTGLDLLLRPKADEPRAWSRCATSMARNDALELLNRRHHFPEIDSDQGITRSL
jgi:hypothetical protein